MLSNQEQWNTILQQHIRELEQEKQDVEEAMQRAKEDGRELCRIDYKISKLLVLYFEAIGRRVSYGQINITRTDTYPVTYIFWD